MAVEPFTVEGWLKRIGAGRALLEVAWGASLLATLGEAAGWLTRGLRFLGQFGHVPLLALGLLALLGVPLWYSALRALRRPAALSRTRRALSWGVLALHVAVVVVLAANVLRYDVVHAEAAAPGARLVVAVADFGVGPEFASGAAGREASAFLSRSLRRAIDLQPLLAGEVSVVSVGLVADEQAALRAASNSGAQLLLWGWVTEGGSAMAPSFQFVSEPGEPAIEPHESPPWYDVEISGDGAMELGQVAGERAAGLVHYVLGLMYLHGADYPRAAAEFDAALAMTSADLERSDLTSGERRALARTAAILHVALGRTLAAQGQSEGGREHYLAALDVDADYAIGYTGLGNLAYAERRFEEALIHYGRAVDLAPRRAAGWYARGNAHFFLQQYEAAAADYERATLLAADDPRLPLYHLVLGAALCRAGHSEQGSRALERAAALAAAGGPVALAAVQLADDCLTAPILTPTVMPTIAHAATPTLAPSPTALATATTTKTPSSTPTPSPNESATTAAMPLATPLAAPSAPTATAVAPEASATPTADVLRVAIRVEGALDALQAAGQVKWTQVAVECVDAQGLLLDRLTLTGAQGEYALPRATALVRLWIGEGLGGAAWWQRWRCDPQRAAPEIVLRMVAVATPEPTETLFPTAFVQPPTRPPETPTANSAAAARRALAAPRD